MAKETLADRVFRGLKHFLTWFCQILLAGFFLSMLAVVVLRFIFDAGLIVLQDLQAYLFAALVFLSVPLAHVQGKHVRAQLTDKESTDSAFKGERFRVLELVLAVGTFLVVLLYSLPDIFASWASQEGSRELGGLGGYFLVRTLLPVMCVLMIFISVLRFRSK